MKIGEEMIDCGNVYCHLLSPIFSFSIHSLTHPLSLLKKSNFCFQLSLTSFSHSVIFLYLRKPLEVTGRPSLNLAMMTLYHILIVDQIVCAQGLYVL